MPRETPATAVGDNSFVVEFDAASSTAGGADGGFGAYAERKGPPAQMHNRSDFASLRRSHPESPTATRMAPLPTVEDNSFVVDFDAVSSTAGGADGGFGAYAEWKGPPAQMSPLPQSPTPAFAPTNAEEITVEVARASGSRALKSPVKGGFGMWVSESGDVESVTAGGPAAVAGMPVPSQIVAVNGVEIKGKDEMLVKLKSIGPGETVSFRVSPTPATGILRHWESEMDLSSPIATSVASYLPCIVCECVSIRSDPVPSRN